MLSRMRFMYTPLVLLLMVVPAAFGQIDTKLEPRFFEGSPLSARIQGPAPSGNVELFRVYTFNAKGWLEKIEQGTTQMGVTLTVSYTNDDQGRPTIAESEFMGNPTNRVEFTYDDKGRCTGRRQVMIKNDKLMKTIAYEHDDAGNITRETMQIPGRKPEVVAREFDDQGRLARETTTTGDRLTQTVRKEYDDNGCLVKSVVQLANGRESWSVWAQGEDCRPNKLRVTNFTGVKTDKAFTYDAYGNPKVEIITQPDKQGSEPVNMVWSYVYPKTVQPPDSSKTTNK